MKSFNPIIIVSSLIISISSCEKENIEPKVASVNIVNAAVGAGTVKVNYFGTPIIWANYIGAASNVAANAGVVFSLPVGNNLLQIVRAEDTTVNVFNSSLNAMAGEVYSLYLIGQVPYEHLLVKENVPYISYNDSSLNVRVVNLSPDAPEVNVTLSTTNTVNEFSSLAYKQSSEFKKYSASAAIGTTYKFEIRKTSDNSLITSANVPLNTYRFKSITLVLRGLMTGNPAMGVSIIKNY